MEDPPTGLRGLLRASTRRDFREPSPLSDVICPSFRLHKPSRLEAFDSRNSSDTDSSLPGSRSSSRHGRGIKQDETPDAPGADLQVEFDESLALVNMFLEKRIKTLPSKEQRLLRYKHLPDVYQLLLEFGDMEWRNLSKRVVHHAITLVASRREQKERKKQVLDGKNVFSSATNDVRLEASFRCGLYRLLKYDDLEKRVLCEMVKERAPTKQPETLADSLKCVSSKHVIKPNTSEDTKTCGEDNDVASNSTDSELQKIFLEVEKQRLEAAKVESVEHDIVNKPSDPPVRRKTKRAQRKTIFKLQGGGGTPRLMTDILRLFSDLRMPIKRRFGFLIKYSSEGKWRDLAAAVAEWSEASKWIIAIEHIVGVIVTAEHERVNPANALRDSQVKLLESANCYISMAKMFGVSTQVWLYAILERAFPHCQNVLLSIRRRWDDVLTFQGHDYLEDRVSPFLDFNLNRKRASDRYPFKVLDHKDAADTSFDITRVAGKSK